jgi:hypothetical protein
MGLPSAKCHAPSRLAGGALRLFHDELHWAQVSVVGAAEVSAVGGARASPSVPQQKIPRKIADD